jgi:hypothetical protein
MIKQIQVEDHINKIILPENLKVRLMITQQREKCTTMGCDEELNWQRL